MSDSVRVKAARKMEGLRRFGAHTKGWKLRCPSCGHFQSVLDFKHHHKGISAVKTVHGLATSIAAVKTALASHVLSTDQAIDVLWDLAIEASSRRDLQYVKGTSAVIDRLCNRLETTQTSIHLETTVMSMHIVKKALIRAEGYPLGQPAPLYLNCDCGREVAIDKPEWQHTLKEIATRKLSRYTCLCGNTYDCRGWLVTAREF